jgi:acyl-CoA synthetase (AMP-forming)/AMP-acid ligase II
MPTFVIRIRRGRPCGTLPFPFQFDHHDTLESVADSSLTIASLLAAPDARALAIADTSRRGLTYGELRALVDRTHHFLHASGLETGDTVAVALRNGPETAALFTALVTWCRVGPLNPGYTRREFAFALRSLAASAIITSGDVPEAALAANECGVRRMFIDSPGETQPGVFELRCDVPPALPAPLPPPPGPDDIALLLHTSGTTALPKLVPLTQRNLTLSARGVARSLQLTPADTCLAIMPLFHVHGLVAGLLASLSAGATACLAPGFRATAFFSWLDSSQATWYTAVPAMHQAILTRAGHNMDVVGRHKLRLIRSCSSTLYSGVWEKLRSVFGVPVLNAYGMTEAAHQISSVPLPGASCASVGLASGPEIGIMDADGSLLHREQVGEVVLRGEQIMSGYLQPEGVNQSAFSNGWFRTGDEGFQDSGGSLCLTGRLKEMINCGGEKISPCEVEEALLLHPDVEQAIAFATPDAVLGETVAAAIVVREGCQIQERDLLSTAARHLARRKLPRQIFFVAEIPRGATGKPQRIGMAARLGVAGSAA